MVIKHVCGSRGGLIMAKHKHAELIKAWADGAEIEILCNSGWVSEDNPEWYPEHKYRIKHEPNVEYLYLNAELKNGEYGIGCSINEENNIGGWNVKLTFTDGKLTNAEVAK